MTQLSIRRMIEEDILSITKLMRESFGTESEFYLSYYPVATRFPIVVAEQNSSLLGIGVTYLKELHPHWAVVMVAVDKNFRRQGIGKHLHEAVIKARELGREVTGLQGYCYQGEEDAEKFMTALGYELRVNCHILELDLTKRKLSPRLARKYGHLEIVPFTTLLESPDTKQHVFDFLVTRYSEEHIWSPPQPKEHSGWEEIVFEDLMPELSFVLLDGGTIIATSTVVDDVPEVLNLCWQYVSRAYSKDEAVFLLQHLLAHQFRVALEAGLVKAEAEVDIPIETNWTSDVYGALLEWLPLQKDQVWQIFQKPF
jgi:GNAT superfamily N-acetyltransferase